MTTSTHTTISVNYQIGSLVRLVKSTVYPSLIGKVFQVRHPAVQKPGDPKVHIETDEGYVMTEEDIEPVTPRFSLGEEIKVVRTGRGVGSIDVGTTVKVSKVGVYNNTMPGYQVSPAIGNTLTGNYNGYIGEDSFDPIQKISTVDAKKTVEKLKEKIAKSKTIIDRSTKEVRHIETSMINKDEVFKMMALAEATGFPLLLVGPPGVGKTKTVIEYAKAWLNKDGKMTAQDFAEKIYILETDEGTKSSEVKGMPDLEKLFTHNQYELNAPISQAEIVVINEVDKASSGIRNAMLGVMNEKFLFNGKHKIPCKWKLFVATCNEIPKEEIGNPFWDRFMLKLQVNRVSASEIMQYYTKGGRDYRQPLKLNIPSKEEIKKIEIPAKKLEKYLEVGYSQSSDRTLTFVPTMARAISYIWDVSVDKALVKTAQLMISQAAGSELGNKLMSSEVKVVMSKVEMLNSYKNNEQLELAIAEIESLINAYTQRGIMDEVQVAEIESVIQYTLDKHPARRDILSAEEVEDMVSAM